NPEEFSQMVKRTRQLEQALGTSEKTVVAEEAETVIVQRRSLYAKADISRGEMIKNESLIELRPALGILPKFKPEIIGKKSKRDIAAGEVIKWEDIE
ncbi:MAG: SAF domain-containing protein, partial [Patescibacteria group bacterium]|nr:SAF domain-containing protein [Patescibacteria group bacterium]